MAKPKSAPDPDPTIELVWDGRTYLIPPSMDECTMETFEANERGNIALLVASVLGEEQWADLKKNSKPKARERFDIARAIAKAWGVDIDGSDA